ncbi:MAG: hypothetical protein QNJ14_08565 [Woeseiaceae bacterium]|nr:hypothetical protein [Woeseiaceae bacterium]
MSQELAYRRSLLPSRRAAALLLAVLLNLALVPCSMAIEVVEEGHDCCPPELKYEPQECCELDDASIDSRSGSLADDLTPDLMQAAAGTPSARLVFSPAQVLASRDPPDPPGPSIDLHKRNCVYLK